MSPIFSIDNISAAQRVQAWREAVCDTFVKLECDPVKNQPMHGRLEAGHVGDLHVARVRSSPQTVRRTKSLASQANEAFVLMSIQSRGKTLIQQGASEALLTPGCIAFYDTSRPYQLTLPNDFDQIVLHLPRETVLKNNPDAINQMAQIVDANNPFAQAIAAIAPQLLRASEFPSSGVAQKAAVTMIDLISLTLSSLEDRSTVLLNDHSLQLPADTIVWHVQELIARQLQQPDLSPAKLAAQSHMSLRRLQEIFKNHGTTVSECLWEMRLNFVRTSLASVNHNADAISVIAGRAGFSDMAHFSRRFKARFGVSAGEFRKIAHKRTD